MVKQLNNNILCKGTYYWQTKRIEVCLGNRTVPIKISVVYFDSEAQGEIFVNTATVSC